ncbi:MAG: PIG-L family deacetylase [Thermoanaerobaculia bacterium]|nr:PIG-L family deacetylase [Thermoanaerobaculia bacterium]
MLDLVVLSPHLDDAALSCGGLLAARARAGERVAVATVFTADEPSVPPSRLAADLARWWGLAPGSVMRARREEDLAACRALGVEALHLDLPEAPYRRDPASGEILYRELARLFPHRRPDEPATAEALDELLAALPPAAEVWAPLGVGRHVDHQLLKRAAEGRFPTALRYYEEYPYAARGLLGVWRATRPRAAWRGDVLPLAEEDLAARCAAIACYASQLAALFGGAHRMERAVRRHVHRRGGERLWRRRKEEA